MELSTHGHAPLSHNNTEGECITEDISSGFCQNCQIVRAMQIKPASQLLRKWFEEGFTLVTNSYDLWK